MIALAVLVPTVAIAYLAAWRIAYEWPIRHRLTWVPWLTLWSAAALSAVGFGIALLWLEILAFHLGHAPEWGLRFYAPAIETVAAIDVLSLAVTAVNHAVIRTLRNQPILRWRIDADDVADLGGGFRDGMVNVADLGNGLRNGMPGASGGRGGLGAADLGGGSSGGGGFEWPGLGLDLGAGEEGAILALGVALFLLAAFLVAISLVGGGFATYLVLRAHARV